MSIYEDNKSDSCSSCENDCSCQSCCETNDCGCKMELDTKCSRYTGATLECLDIKEGDNLETIIQKLEEKYCNIKDVACDEVGLALYEMWLEAGNTGTLEDFLATLVGTDGIDGVDGADGTDGVDGTNGTDGADGTNGTDGADGTNGTDGISITWLGDFAVAPVSPNLNEAYYDTVQKESFIWDGAAWQTLAKDGADGSALSTAKQIHNIVFGDIVQSSANITINSLTGTFNYKDLGNKMYWYSFVMDMDLTVTSGTEDGFLGIEVQNLPITFDNAGCALGEFTFDTGGGLEVLDVMSTELPSTLKLNKISFTLSAVPGLFPNAQAKGTGIAVVV